MSEKEKLLVMGQVFGLLSRFFDYPDVDIQKDLISGTFMQRVSQALHNLPRQSELEKFAVNINSAILQMQGKSSDLEEEYTYLFYRNVLLPPNESRYNETQQGLSLSTLSDLASFYAAFGLQLQDRAGELTDHITVELEFLSTLFFKEAYALEKGWQDKAEICRDARRKFLKEHIGRWFGSFSENIRQKARTSFYPSLAAFTQALLSLELELSSKS